MKAVSIILLSTVVLFCSCKRERCPFPGTKIKATVLDETTLHPVSNIKVDLFRYKCKRDFLGENCLYKVDIKSEMTDDNGYFELNFCRADGRRYFLYIDPGIWYDGYIAELDTFSSNVLLIDPLGVLKINVKNFNNKFYKIILYCKSINGNTFQTSSEGYNLEVSAEVQIYANKYSKIEYALFTEDYTMFDTTKRIDVIDSVRGVHKSVVEYNIIY